MQQTHTNASPASNCPTAVPPAAAEHEGGAPMSYEWGATTLTNTFFSGPYFLAKSMRHLTIHTFRDEL